MRQTYSAAPRPAICISLSTLDTVTGAAVALACPRASSVALACPWSLLTEQPASSSATSAGVSCEFKASAPLDLADVAHRTARRAGSERGIGAQGGADFALA